MGCDSFYPTDSQLAERNRLDAMRQRGYSQSRSITGADWNCHPCGSIIHNPDTHERFCPAKVRSEV
jgi:hypothetical protein